MTAGARDWYEDGVADHYREHGDTYRNPHMPIVNTCVDRAIALWSLDTSAVLDLAAGSGELTQAILRVKPQATVFGCDPFTFTAYEQQTGMRCEQLTFEAIAAGAMRERRYSLIGCSFAMHLCPLSILPQLALELAQLSPRLLILTPHKRPSLREAWGWRSIDEFVEQRVRARLYASTIAAATLDSSP